MPQNPTPTPPPAKFVFDADKVAAKAKELREYYQAFSGKQGYNPHFFLHNLGTLLARVEHGDNSEDLYNTIMSLEKKEPVAPGCSPIVDPKAK